MSHDALDTSPPDDELDPDEPRTPLWMPILGLGLFLLALVFALSGAEEPTGETPGEAPGGGEGTEGEAPPAEEPAAH